MAVKKNASGDAGGVWTNSGVLPTRANDCTISFWLKAAGNTAMMAGITNASNRATFFGFNSSLQVCSNVNGGGNSAFSGTGYTDAKWYFMAFVFTESNDTWTAYLGHETAGASSIGTRDVSALTDQGWPTSSGRVEIGSATGGLATISQNSEIAYVRVWNSALDATAIEAERLKKSAVASAVWLEVDMDAASDAGVKTDQSANGRTLSYSTGSASDWTTSADPADLTDGASAVAPSIILPPNYSAFSTTNSRFV